uniref:RRM domain-containing protein n=1 Tax=Kalanchoe fedtschenkoi TaxID=63787 RepID=A0A7N0T5V6_KALFE
MRDYTLGATSAIDDNRRRLRSVATVSSVPEVALKAAAEAAEDVLRVRPSGNVFDRLGRGIDVLDNVERTADFTDNVADGDYEFNDRLAAQSRLNPHRVIKDSRRYAGDKSVRSTRIELINHENEFSIDTDQDLIDHTDAMGYKNRSLPQTSTSVQMDDDSTARHVNPATSYKLKRKYQNQPAAVVHPSYDETVNVPANANIWKPPPYMSKKESIAANSSRVNLSGDAAGEMSGVHLLKENRNGVVGNGNGNSAIFRKTELPKTTSRATGAAANVLSLEDADARTLFVNNVHFAATKENLSRHFSKFGQVLRVTILKDAATGQPKGSAYVEFMQKETAEQATSLDGTSFMSRIIKVCMKGSAQPEATTPATPWQRAVPRGSPYPVSRFSRAPFPRRSPSSIRGRSTVRPGARSLQWKRDAQLAPATSEVAGHSASIPARSLTYVRPELKAGGTTT